MALQYNANALLIAFTFCTLFFIVLTLSVRFVLRAISKPIFYIIFFVIAPSILFILYALDVFPLPLWEDFVLDNVLALIAGIIIPCYTVFFVMRYYRQQKEFRADPPSVSSIIGIYFLVCVISAIGFPDAIIPNIIAFCIGIVFFMIGSWQKSWNTITIGKLFILTGIVGFLMSFFIGEIFGWSFSATILLLGISTRSKMRKSDTIPLVEYCKDHLDDDKCDVFFTEQDII